MRPWTLFWLCLLVYAALIGWQALSLPDQVPAHLDYLGNVTRWGSRSTHVLGAFAIGAFLSLVFVGTPRLLRYFQTALTNIPNAEFWARPENRARMEQMMSEDMAAIGAATFLLLCVVMAQIGAVAKGSLIPGWLSLVFLVVYFISLLAWASWMYLGPRYRERQEQQLGAQR